jgi:tripartite-type tricarboxylate transporter receptor subunit TctC
MVPVSSPYKTVAELVKASKADPKGLTAANGGIGGSHHLSAELLKQSTGANLVTVSYKGGGPAATDLMAGNVDMLFEQMYAAMPSIQSGKARALAISSKTRLALVPDVPTVAESAGVPGFEVMNWQGLIAPKGTPRAIIDKLNAAANQALKTPDLRQKITSQGNEPIGGTPEEFAALIKSESQKWGAVVKKADIKPE